MKLAVCSVFGTFAALACPIAANADPITLVAIQRYVTSTASAGSDGGGTTIYNSDTLTSTTTRGSGTASASGTATLDSIASPSTRTFSGISAASAIQTATSVGSDAQGITSYQVEFDLTRAQAYSFSAAFTGIGDFNDHLSHWEAVFSAGENLLFDSRESGTSGNQAFSQSGLLPPGRYGLEVSTIAETFGQQITSAATGSTFALTFSDPAGGSPTPEPASLLLLGTGIAGLLARRRRGNAGL